MISLWKVKSPNAQLVLLLSIVFLIPAFAHAVEQSETIPNQYIVVLQDEVDGVGLSVSFGVTTIAEYEHVFNGFAMQATEDQAKELESDPRVKFIQPDIPAYSLEQIVPTGIKRVESPHPGTGYVSPARILIMDSGLWKDHPDLNVVGGFNFINSNITDWDDGQGHGTHTGGTAAACDNDIGVVGLAPCAELTAYRVLDDNGFGTFSGIIAAIDHIIANKEKYDVVNMSFGGGLPSAADRNCGIDDNDAVHMAYCKLRDSGVVAVVAAGNFASDSARTIPAGYDDAVITVSALSDGDGLPGGLQNPSCRGDKDDRLAAFSNFGANVDIIAPGVCINSSVPPTGAGCCSDPSLYKEVSGTSMSAPHVTGWVAEYIVNNEKPTNWEEIREIRNAMRQIGFDGDGAKGWTGDRDRYKEPLLNSNTGYKRLQLSDSEILVDSLTGRIFVNDTVKLTGVLENIGTTIQTVNYEILINDLVLKNETLTIQPNIQNNLSVEWIAEHPSVGNTIATFRITTDDDNLKNNIITFGINIVNEGDVDVAILEFAIPPEMAIWERPTFNFTIKNEGVIRIDNAFISLFSENRQVIDSRFNFGFLQPGQERSFKDFGFIIGDGSPLGEVNVTALLDQLKAETNTKNNVLSATSIVVNNTARVLPPLAVIDVFDNSAQDGNTTKNYEILANDGDPNYNLDPSTVTITHQPLFGEVEVFSNGTISYKSINGTDGVSFYEFMSYTVKDTTDLTSVHAVIFILVTNKDAPIPPPEPPEPPVDDIERRLQNLEGNQTEIIDEITRQEDEDTRLDERITKLTLDVNDALTKINQDIIKIQDFLRDIFKGFIGSII